jgi:S1-C subfamily serine protease
VEPGGATLKIRAAGFAPLTQKITIEKERGKRATRLPRFTLEQEAVVEGTVVDERGNPVPGARVGTSPASVYTVANRAAEATTDARGVFRLGELPKGSAAIHVYAADLGRAVTESFSLAAGEVKRIDRIVLKRAAADSALVVESGPTLALTLGEASESGQVVIVAVAPAGGAERSGLRTGDIVLAVQGTRVKSIAEARRFMTGPLSDDVLVEVQRGDRELSIRAARDTARK